VTARIVLQPYLEPGGWAAPGHAWVSCTVSVTPRITGKTRFDVPATMAVRLPAGQLVPAPPGTLASPNADNEPAAAPKATATVNLDVPDTTAVGTMVVHPFGALFLTFNDRPTLYSELVSFVVASPAELAFDLTG